VQESHGARPDPTLDPATLRHNGDPGADYAVIKLDRKVAGRQPLLVNRFSKLAPGDKLFVIGHPVGLPLKVAVNAVVRDASPKFFFMTDLDTFSGNSGSAVFNVGNNLIEGILVRGDIDFEDSSAGCKVASVMPQNGGAGKAVTKISVIQQFCVIPIRHTGAIAILLILRIN
jgi:S1-C subfamily serine protease